MDIETQIRTVVREEIASCGLVSAAADPELISVAETVVHLGNVVREGVIYDLHKRRHENDFPSVQIGRTIAVDKRRLNAWVASGGLEMGVKE